MAFTSAELKKLYEQLQDLGYPISPSRAASLFRSGTLAALVVDVINRSHKPPPITPPLDPGIVKQGLALKALMTKTFGITLTNNREVLALQGKLDSLTTKLANVQRGLDELYNNYQTYASMYQDYLRNKPHIERLNRQLADLTDTINALASQLQEAQESLRHLLTHRGPTQAQINALQRAVDQAQSDMETAQDRLSNCYSRYGHGTFHCRYWLHKTADAQSAYYEALDALDRAKANQAPTPAEIQRRRDHIAALSTELQQRTWDRWDVERWIRDITGGTGNGPQIKRTRDSLYDQWQTLQTTYYNLLPTIKDVTITLTLATRRAHDTKRAYDAARKAYNKWCKAYPQACKAV